MDLPELIEIGVQENAPIGIDFETIFLMDVQTTVNESDVCNVGIDYIVLYEGQTVTETSMPLRIKEKTDKKIVFTFFTESFLDIGDKIVQVITDAPYDTSGPATRRLQDLPPNPFEDNPFADQLVLRVTDPCEDPYVFTASTQPTPADYEYVGSLNFNTVPFFVFPTECDGAQGSTTYVCEVASAPPGAADICDGATFTADGSFSFSTTDKDLYPPGAY